MREGCVVLGGLVQWTMHAYHASTIRKSGAALGKVPYAKRDWLSLMAYILGLLPNGLIDGSRCDMFWGVVGENSKEKNERKQE